jgi:uncharacterized membrane protein
MYIRPTRATPAGCVVALFGFAALVYAALSGWALVLAIQVSNSQRNHSLIERLALNLAISLGIGVLLVWLGWRIARRADMSDPQDPKKPMIRF